METNNIYIVFIFEYRIVFKVFSFVPCFSFNKLRDQMNHSHARTHTHRQTDVIRQLSRLKQIGHSQDTPHFLSLVLAHAYLKI